MKIFKDTPRPGEVYLYRTRKPWFTILPKLRHNGYAGQTRSALMRDQEHRTGVGRYGRKEPAPWSDLDPVRYVVWSSDRVRDWRLNLMEWLVIKLFLPVYNHQHNLSNPRRVTRNQARAMRTARDQGAPKWLTLRPGHLVQLGFVLVAGTLLASRF